MTRNEAIKILNAWLAYFKEEYEDWEQTDEAVALDTLLREPGYATCSEVLAEGQSFCPVCGSKVE